MPDFLYKNAGIAEIYDRNYLKDHAIVRNGNWNDFVRSIKTKNRFHSLHINLEKLRHFCSYCLHDYKTGMRFFRGRIVGTTEGIQAEQMGAPPTEIAKAGRVNSDGISRLYLSSNKETVIHEIRAGAYDFITIGVFVLKKDIKVVDFRTINNISPFFGDMDPLEYAVNKSQLNLIGAEMAKALRASDTPIDYVPTQYIADYIQSLGEYAGIEYKSTMNPDGYNLAVFDPELFTCTDTETVRISRLTYEWK
jgi:hypothetical protein